MNAAPSSPQPAQAAIAWQPDNAFVEATNWTAFIRAMGEADYIGLAARAEADPAWFWEGLIRFLDIRFRRPFDRVLDAGDGPEWVKWCVGGRMNMNETLIERNLERGRADHPAIVWEGEDGTVCTVTYAALADETARAAAGLPALRHVVTVHRLGTKAPASGKRAGRDVTWESLVARAAEGTRAVELDAEAPLMIVYTSGTTGKPKGTVHTHCGFLAKTGEDFTLCFDLKPDDRLLWMTDIGWLVSPIQITAALIRGATLVLAEGTPDYPEPGRLWRIVQDHRVSFLGIGSTIARLLMRYGRDVSGYDLSSLRVAASTGEPWDQDSCRWIFDCVLGGSRPLMNYSGGTEMGGLLATNPLFPIKPASFNGPIPGPMPTFSTMRATQPDPVKSANWSCAAHATVSPRGCCTTPGAISTTTGAGSPASRCTATGRRAMPTATGTCTDAPTIPSSWPASTPVRRRSNRWRCRRVSSATRLPSRCPTR